MFSAKQQKNPVSRTISAPERRGVKQMAGLQSSMANRGVIQRMEAIYYYSSPKIRVDNEEITFTGPLDNGGASLEYITRPNQYVALFSFRKEVYSDMGGYVHFRDQFESHVMPRNQEYFHIRSARRFESDLAFIYAALIPQDKLSLFLELEKMKVIHVSVLFEPQIDPKKYFSNVYGMAVSVTNQEAETSYRMSISQEPVKGEQWNADQLKTKTFYNKGAYGVYLTALEYSRASEDLKESYANGLIEYKQRRRGQIDLALLEAIDPRLRDAYINEKFKKQSIISRLFRR